MIAHALTIVINELNLHLTNVYGESSGQAVLGNPSEGFDASNGGMSRDLLNCSVLNIREEKALKNQSNIVRDEVTQKVLYENPPVYLNFQILITAPSKKYADGLKLLSRAIRFFQYKNVFTQDNVNPDSITQEAPNNDSDCLVSFKLIFDLYSASMEEVNHLWGTLGGKQYPFVIYWMRMLDLQFRAVEHEGSLITAVETNFTHNPVPLS